MEKSSRKFPTQEIMTLQNHFARGKERVMPIERGSCRFNLRKTSEGKPVIEMEMFHNTVALLAAVTLSFEVLGGITIEQTRDLIEKMNDQIVGVALTPR